MNTLEIFTTGRCNLHCTYCHVSGRLPQKDMEYDVCRKAINLNLELLCPGQELSIHLTGGEPFLNKNLIIRCLKEFGDVPSISWRITTNGTLLNETWFKLLSKYGVSISVSIDGIEKAHNKHRIGNKNWYNRIISTISQLQMYHIPCEVGVSVHPDCVGMLVSGVLFLIRIGVKRLSVAPAYSTSIDWPIGSIGGLCNSLLEISKIAAKNNVELIPITFECDHIGRKYESIWGCGAGCNTLAVMPNGELIGCSALAPYVNHFPLARQGDVHFGLSKIQNEKLCSVLQKGETDRVSCRNCDIKDDCAGGCAAINFAMTGNVHVAPGLYCSLIRATRIAWQARYGSIDSIEQGAALDGNFATLHPH